MAADSTNQRNHFLATINTDSDLWNKISRHREERFNSEFQIPELKGHGKKFTLPVEAALRALLPDAGNHQLVSAFNTSSSIFFASPNSIRLLLL